MHSEQLARIQNKYLDKHFCMGLFFKSDEGEFLIG